MLRQLMCHNKSSNIVYLKTGLTPKESNILVLLIFFQAFYLKAIEQRCYRFTDLFKQRQGLYRIGRNGYIQLSIKRSVKQYFRGSQQFFVVGKDLNHKIGAVLFQSSKLASVISNFIKTFPVGLLFSKQLLGTQITVKCRHS